MNKRGNYLKGILGISFLVLVCFLLTGCQGDITRGIRHAGFNLSNTQFVCDYFVSDNEEMLISNRMKFLSSSYAVDQDGVVFELSLVQKYSNQQNCKKSDFSKKVVALFDNKIAKCDDNKIYYMTGDGNAQIYSEVGVLDHSYEIYNLLLGVSDVVKIITVDQNNGVYYLLKNDGNIYKYVISRADTQSPYKIDLNGVIYSKENYGFINDFNYSDSNKISTYIMSNDKLYRMKKMNGEECDKFVDISCKYELVEDSSLMEYKRYISGFDGSMLITNYGKVFNILG